MYDNRVVWNVWHGCRKVSTGCKNCYMYEMDKSYGVDPTVVSLNKNLDFPIATGKGGLYKVPDYSHIMVNLTSDTFLEECRPWLPYIWSCVEERKNCLFHIITKRPENITDEIEYEINKYNNLVIDVTCENKMMMDRRLEVMSNIRVPHLWLCLAPLLEDIDFEDWLSRLKVEWVSVSGERSYNARPINFDWVMNIRDQCIFNGVNFDFFETGSYFIKEGKKYYLKTKELQNEQARKAGIDYLANVYDYTG